MVYSDASSRWPSRKIRTAGGSSGIAAAWSGAPDELCGAASVLACDRSSSRPDGLWAAHADVTVTLQFDHERLGWRRETLRLRRAAEGIARMIMRRLGCHGVSRAGEIVCVERVGVRERIKERVRMAASVESGGEVRRSSAHSLRVHTWRKSGQQCDEQQPAHGQLACADGGS